MGFYIDMIHVGYGDCFMLTLDDDDGNEHCVLIDGGPAGSTEKLIEHASKYAPCGFDLVIGTHLDEDHIGGLIDVLETFEVGALILNTPGTMYEWLEAREALKGTLPVKPVEEMIKGVETADDLLRVAERKGIPVDQGLAGTRWRFGSDIALTICNPTEDRLAKAWAEEVLKNAIGARESVARAEALEAAPPTTDSNNASIVLELWYDAEAYGLFSGDAGAEVLKEVTSGASYAYVKVPHHGSMTGLDEELVQQLSPEIAHIPVGNNPHGHPDRNLLRMLHDVEGLTIYCSGKVDDCYPNCRRDWGDVVCHRGGGKPRRERWTSLDASKCPVNV